MVLRLFFFLFFFRRRQKRERERGSAGEREREGRRHDSSFEALGTHIPRKEGKKLRREREKEGDLNARRDARTFGVHERLSARTRSVRRDTRDITYHEMHVRFVDHFESVDTSAAAEPGDSAGNVRGDLLAELRVFQE